MSQLHAAILILSMFGGPEQRLSVSAEDAFTFKAHRAVVLNAEIELKPGFKVARVQWRTRSIEVDLRPTDIIETATNEDGTTAVTVLQGARCSVWAPPGTYEVTLDAWLINWTAQEFDTIERIFTITIEGARPPPGPTEDDDPPPPDEQTSGKVFSVVIAEAARLTAQQSKTLLDLRTFADRNQAAVSHTVFPPDAENADGSKNETVQKYVAKLPSGARFPFVFFVQLTADGRAVVKWSGELPDDATDLITRLEALTK